MDFFETVRKRHSVRSYKTTPVEDEKVKRILETARLAPTAANKQAFKLLIIPTVGREEELKTIYKRDWFVKAPIVLGICAIPKKAWVRIDGKNYSDVDAAIVMDHITLAAAALELGTCWIGAFNYAAAKKVLKLDDELEPIVFTPLGYAADHDFNKMRKDLDEIVIYK